MLSVACDRCGGTIEPDHVVTVNGRKLHPLMCFATELRSIRGSIEVGLAQAMAPMQAYQLGEAYYAAVIAPRRRRELAAVRRKRKRKAKAKK